MLGFKPIFPVPTPRLFIEPTVVFDTIRAAIKLSFGASDERTTFFGGRVGDPVWLLPEDVNKLPHDLVCLLFSTERERHIDPAVNRTPDLVYPLEDGTSAFIEVATRDFGGDFGSGTYSAIMQKKRHLRDLIESDAVSAYNVLVVTHGGAFDRMNAQLEPWSMQQCVAAYTWGMRVKERFFDMHPRLRLKPAPEMSEAIRMFSSIKPKTTGVFREEPPVERRAFRLSRMADPTNLESFEAYRAKADGAMDARTDPRPVAHVPFALVDRRDAQATIQIHEGDFPEPWSSIINQFNVVSADLCSSRSFEELEFSARFGADDSRFGRLDQISVPLSDASRYRLAERGVMAKSIAQDLEWNAERKILSSRPFAITSNYSDIDRWVEGPVEFIDPSMARHLHPDAAIGQTDPSIRSVQSALLESEDFECLRFLDLVTRECVYNAHRNPRDKGGEHEFIVRPVPGYEAIVILRTTRMSGLDSPPVFYSVVARGVRARGPFEQWLDAGEWSFTEFASTSLRRAEQTTDSLAVGLGLYGLLAETLGDGLGPDTRLTDLTRLSSIWRRFMLVQLEDSGQTAETLQLTRYYYMKLLSGRHDCVPGSEQIASKFPSIIRSRLTAYFLDRWFSIHEKIPADFHLSLRHRRDDDSESTDGLDEFSKEAEEKLPLFSSECLESIMGYTFTDMDSILLTAYACVLPNKGESRFIHGDLQIVNKMVKTAYLNVDRKAADNHTGFEKPGAVPSSIREFEFDPESVAAGCRLFKSTVCTRMGIQLSEWDTEMEKRIASFCLRSVVSELATTKGSTIPFDPDVTFSGVDRDDEPGRQKCFEALLRLIGAMDDPRTAMNVRTVIKGIDEEEHGCILATEFLKNQIGVREILVLTLRGRWVTKVYQDMYRAIAELHPSENLMNESGQFSFLDSHGSKIRGYDLQFRSTIKISADKKQWAPRFNYHSFRAMDLCLLPPCFRGFAQRVLEMHRDKRIALPDGVRKTFMSERSGELSEAPLQRLRDEYLGRRPAELLPTRGVLVMGLRTDMMMGILHYTSSVYHVCHMELYRSLMIQSLGLNHPHVTPLIDFECSSDDSGVLNTVMGSDREDVRRASGWLLANSMPMMRNVDRLFGVATSEEKTTLTGSDVFEFKSDFTARNHVASPLIKFVRACCTQSVAPSLHQRVTQLYSSLCQLRDRGATGYLCAWVSGAQSLLHYRNLGFGTMEWFDQPLATMFPTRTSFEGFYATQPPHLSGIVDAVYQNYVASKADPVARRLVSRLGTYGVPLDEEISDVARFRVYPMRKYEACLKRLGLDGVRRCDLITPDNFEMFFRESFTIDEERVRAEIMAVNPMVAASMARLTRSHNVRMTPYVLWAALYRVEAGIATREDLIRRAAGGGPDVDLNLLFPMHRELDEIIAFSSRPLAYEPSEADRRLKYRWVEPYYGTEEHRTAVKTICAAIWYGERRTSLSDSKIARLWALIQAELPFMSDTVEDTLSRSPFDDHATLLSFLEGYATERRGRRVLARGAVTDSLAPVHLLSRFNTARGYNLRVLNPDEVGPPLPPRTPRVSYDLRLFVQRTASRMKSWYEVALGADESEVDDVMSVMVSDLRFVMMSCPDGDDTGNRGLNDELTKFRLLAGLIDTRDAWDTSETMTLYTQFQRLERGRYVGDASAYVRRAGVSSYCRLAFVDKEVTAYSSDSLLDLQLQLPGRWKPHHLVRTTQSRPDRATFVAIKTINGSRMAEFRTDLGGVYYMQTPWVNPYSQTHNLSNPDLPDWMNSWLMRNPMDAAGFDGLRSSMTDDGPAGLLARSMIETCGSLSSKKALTQLEERLGSASLKPTVAEAKDPIAFALELIEMIEPLTDAELMEDAEGFLEDLFGVEHNIGMFDDVTVMIHEPNDYYKHTLHLNETMKFIRQIVDAAHIMGRLDPDTRRLVDAFDDAAARARDQRSGSDSDD